MENNFSKKFVSRLDGTLSPSVLKLIYEELEIFTADYEIRQKKHDVAEYHPDVYPEALQVYLVSKKIEGKSDQTLYWYRMILEDFFRSVHIPLEEIRQNDLRRYLYELQKRRGLSNRCSGAWDATRAGPAVPRSLKTGDNRDLCQDSEQRDKERPSERSPVIIQPGPLQAPVLLS